MNNILYKFKSVESMYISLFVFALLSIFFFCLTGFWKNQLLETGQIRWVNRGITSIFEGEGAIMTIRFINFVGICIQLIFVYLTLSSFLFVKVNHLEKNIKKIQNETDLDISSNSLTAINRYEPYLRHIIYLMVVIIAAIGLSFIVISLRPV